MGGYIKYFDNGGKICVLELKMLLYWQNIMKFGRKLKKNPSMKFYSKPVCDEKYVKA